LEPDVAQPAASEASETQPANENVSEAGKAG